MQIDLIGLDWLMLNYIDRKHNMESIVIYIIEIMSQFAIFYWIAACWDIQNPQFKIAIFYFHESICHLGIVLFCFRLTWYFVGLDKAHMHFSESGLICATFENGGSVILVYKPSFGTRILTWMHLFPSDVRDVWKWATS